MYFFLYIFTESINLSRPFFLFYLLWKKLSHAINVIILQSLPFEQHELSDVGYWKGYLLFYESNNVTVIFPLYFCMARTSNYCTLKAKRHKNEVILFSFSLDVSYHRVVTASLLHFYTLRYVNVTDLIGKRKWVNI